MENFAQIVEDYNIVRNCADKGSICHAPESSMYFGRDGMVSACCYSRSGLWGSYPADSIAEIWTSAQANSMRQAMHRNELPSVCSLCADQFIARNFEGLLARQFDGNARPPLPLQPHGNLQPDAIVRYPVRLEFELSNKCNLECTMCSGFYSSSIRANRENLPPLPQLYGKEFVQQLVPFLPHLTHAKFLGGEPFLIDIYYEIWERLIGLNPACRVSITTNGTVFTDKVKRVLEKLNCQIVVSLDSVNQASYESIRRNASLERTLHNVEIFSEINRLKGKRLTIATCAMVSNWREIPEVISYASRRGIRIFLNTVVFPAAHSLKALPVTAQREVLEVYRAYRPELRNEIEHANREALESFCRQIDYWIAESTPAPGEEGPRSPLEKRYTELLASHAVSPSEKCFLSDLLGKTGRVEGQVLANLSAADPVRELRDYFQAVWQVGATLQSEGLLGQLNFDHKELGNLVHYLDGSVSPDRAGRILHEARRFSGQMLQFAGSVTGSRMIEMMEQHLSTGAATAK
jgi:MoaA/NifB/PqqE/SkfB family radical SAM enzyme